MILSVCVCVFYPVPVSELQPLQQLTVQVKKQSVCVKRTERKLSEQAEVSIHLKFNTYKLITLQSSLYFPNQPTLRSKPTCFLLFHLTEFQVPIVIPVGFVSAA